MAFGLIAIVLLTLGVVGLLSTWVADSGAAVAVLLAAVSIVFTVRRVRTTNVALGVPALIGKSAVARTPLTPSGYVFIAGERWAAEMEEGIADVGDQVVIVGSEGFQLRVRRQG
jgi:membrane-bound serine protease (ClpP class)